MYSLSRDYERLFDIVCAGHVVAGFVDFKFDPHDEQEKPCRDIAKIQRRKEWEVSFGVRGMSYASMLSYMGEDLSKTEKDSFCGYCRALNLEWIDPGKEIYEYQSGYDGKLWSVCTKSHYDKFMTNPDLYGFGGYMVRRVAVS